MGKPGRKLWLALVAFAVGGFAGFEAATADSSRGVDGFIRSAAVGDVHAAQAESEQATTLNALPLLPPPVTSVSSEGAEMLTEVNVTSATPGSNALSIHAVATRVAPVVAMNVKQTSRAKKSASWAWTRRSEIIDPWSPRR